MPSFPISRSTHTTCILWLHLVQPLGLMRHSLFPLIPLADVLLPDFTEKTREGMNCEHPQLPPFLLLLNISTSSPAPQGSCIQEEKAETDSWALDTKLLAF